MQHRSETLHTWVLTEAEDAVVQAAVELFAEAQVPEAAIARGILDGRRNGTVTMSAQIATPQLLREVATRRLVSPPPEPTPETRPQPTPAPVNEAARKKAAADFSKQWGGALLASHEGSDG